MPRFVVLHHETPADHERTSHWDLMLESDGVLQTWALDRPPKTGESIPAEPLPDHRLAYLEYEGEVSGDRGRVSQWDSGVYEFVEDSDELIVVRLDGGRLRGELRISQQSEAARISFFPSEAP
jgi:hypothetical protein